MIDVVYNDFFRKKGFVLDDAYDLYKLKNFLKYYLENKIEYIKCKDTALDNLKCFKDLKYLTIPKEAINYFELYKLIDLRGIELCYTQLQLIPNDIQVSLESLILHCGKDSLDFTSIPTNLKELKIDGFPGFNNTDLYFLRGLNLKCLSIMSRKLKTLKGIEHQRNLETLIIHSCSNLYDVSNLSNLKKLKTLHLSECNKLQKNFADFFPGSLEELTVYGSESYGPKCSFPEFDFLQKMKNLKLFKTNWKISPEQLISIRNIVPKLDIYIVQAERLSR